MTANAEFYATKPCPGRYDIGPDGSSVAFRTRHRFGPAPVRGTLRVRSGAVDVTELPGSPRIRVEVDAASFRTGDLTVCGTTRPLCFPAEVSALRCVRRG